MGRYRVDPSGWVRVGGRVHQGTTRKFDLRNGGKRGAMILILNVGNRSRSVLRVVARKDSI